MIVFRQIVEFSEQADENNQKGHFVEKFGREQYYKYGLLCLGEGAIGLVEHYDRVDNPSEGCIGHEVNYDDWVLTL